MVETEEEQNVGELLRNARLKRGKTLSDVSRDLCIRKVYLEAIENLDFACLHPVPYGVGFVRTYSEYLELESAKIVAAYKESAHIHMFSAESKDKEEIVETETGGPKIFHIVLSVLGLLAVLWVWSMMSGGSSADDASVEKEMSSSVDSVPEPVILEEDEPDMEEMGLAEEKNESAGETAEENALPTENAAANAAAEVNAESIPVVEDKAAKEAAQSHTMQNKASVKNIETPGKKKAETSAAAEPVTPTTIRLILRGPSWVEVRKGDQVLVSGNKNKGFTYDIPDEEGMIVSVGRYYNVDFYVNGRLTKVASSLKQMNINLDKYIKKNN